MGCRRYTSRRFFTVSTRLGLVRALEPSPGSASAWRRLTRALLHAGNAPSVQPASSRFARSTASPSAASVLSKAAGREVEVERAPARPNPVPDSRPPAANDHSGVSTLGGKASGKERPNRREQLAGFGKQGRACRYPFRINGGDCCRCGSLAASRTPRVASEQASGHRRWAVTSPSSPEAAGWQGVESLSFGTIDTLGASML
jgi:hypothetical protein